MKIVAWVLKEEEGANVNDCWENKFLYDLFFLTFQACLNPILTSKYRCLSTHDLINLFT